MRSGASRPQATAKLAETIHAVVARLETIQAGLPRTDGVAYFNRLYLAVTKAIGAATHKRTFEDEPFVARLDVVFAGFYLDACGDWSETRTCPLAWRPLFTAGEQAGRTPIQFALAGMNAHINHDLPLAIVETCRQFGIEPVDDSPQHRDFKRVNDVLRGVEKRVQGEFETGLAGDVERAAPNVANALAMWSIADARELAWKHAQTIRHLEGHPHLLAAYEDTLARLVDLGGRGILL